MLAEQEKGGLSSPTPSNLTTPHPRHFANGTQGRQFGLETCAAPHLGKTRQWRGKDDV
jgi:hypothetical protein